MLNNLMVINFSYLLTVLFSLVGLNGLEPSTSRLSGVRSNQLSYNPLHTVLYSASLLVLFFINLAATYFPIPSPA